MGVAAALACALALLLAIAFSPVAHADGGAPNLIYAAGAGADAGDIAIIDIAAKRETGRLTVGGKPHAVVLSFDGRFAYVTQTAANSVAIVDAQAKKVAATLPVGSAPSSLAIDQSVSDNRLFIANSGADSVTVLDPDARKTVATVPVGRGPTGIAVAGITSGIKDTSSSEIWVTNSDSDSVSILSAGSLKMIATIPISGGPESVVVPQTGGVGYIGTRSGAIVAVRVADRRVLGTLLHLRGGASGQMDYSALTAQIYVPDPSGNVLQVLRPASAGSDQSEPFLPEEPLRTLRFDGAPAAIAIPSDGVYGFVASRDAGRIAIFDASSNQTLATFEVGGAPVGLVAGPYPPLLNREASNIAGFILTGLVVAVLAIVASLFICADRRRQQQARAKPLPDATEPTDSHES